MRALFFSLMVAIGISLSSVPLLAVAAIEFNSASQGITASGLTVSFSHTVSPTGSNLILLVGITLQNNTNNISGVTYGGQSMTLAGSTGNGATQLTNLYYLLNPPTGTNNVVATTTGVNITIQAESVSLAGVIQAPPEAVATSSVGVPASSISYSITTLTSNAWIASVFGIGDNETTCIPGGSQVSRVRYCNNNNGASDFTTLGPVSPAGATTVSESWSPNSPSAGSVSVALAPYTSPTITGSGTANRLAKFMSSSTIGDSLLSDDGINITLTNGNLFLQAGKALDAVVSGILNIGTSIANAINVGRSGITTTIHGLLSWTKMGTTSNCSSTTSPANCGSAPAGSIALPVGVATLTVSTTVVTADSQIFITDDFSLGNRLGISCNTSNNRVYSISARTSGASFTIQSDKAPNTNAACLSYFIVN